MAYLRYHKVDTHIVRIFNTYGPKMQINDGRVIPNFMKQALSGEDLTMFGDGKQTRSFCYVSDEMDGIIRLANSTSTNRQISAIRMSSRCCNVRRKFWK